MLKPFCRVMSFMLTAFFTAVCVGILLKAVIVGKAMLVGSITGGLLALCVVRGWDK